jgi:hypothetical protein
MMRIAVVLRSGALALILWQLLLLAGDLADWPVFGAALAVGFLLPVCLAVVTRRGVRYGAARGLAKDAQVGKGRIQAEFRRLLVAAATLALAPWAVRLLVSLPRLFVSGAAALPMTPKLDGLLLGYDRNTFVFLAPYYWTAFSTWFSLAAGCAAERSRKFFRGSVGVDLFILIAVYSIAHTRDAYRWPVLMIAAFGVTGFLELAALIRSLPPEFRVRRGEQAAATVMLLFLVGLGGALFIRPSQEKAVEQGGGLLAPNLFSFDFSKYLKLESQISMNDDLALIVKKDPDDDHTLLRRYVLSGYNKGQGFFRVDEYDERDHPQRLPDRPVNLPVQKNVEKLRATRLTNQEYYLVNFDSQALIGMNRPVQVTPYESWDASSFSSVYAVKSVTSDVLPFELIDLELWPPEADKLELSDAEYRLYTEYGDDPKLRAYAEEIVRGVGGYWDRVQMIYEWFKYGDYRYSLRAGIAPDGDQLSHFLFTSKKGYCSYFAFSCALLLRSMGIPARIGAGFFLDPETNTFDYYPVRSDMAHAWVEVWFPGYGWIEYDPTTENLAEGEEFRISPGVPQELFEKLMREIFGNRGGLRAREGAENSEAGPPSPGAAFIALARRYWPPALLCAVILLFAFLRLYPALAAVIARPGRAKALGLWGRTIHLLRLAGLHRNWGMGEAEWAKEIDPAVPGIYALYQGAARARFAPVFSAEDFNAMKETWRSFTVAFKRAVPCRRRLLAWLAPPLALVLRRPARAGGGPGGAGGAGGASGAAGPAAGLLLLALLCALGGDFAGAQNDDAGGREGPRTADALLADAQDATEAEYWERAIELYQSGGELFPADIRFPWALGNLYQSRSLYSLAWDEYRRAEKLDPTEPTLLYSMSRTAGYLNRDTLAVDYLEQLLEIDPDHREAIGQLGWMYYKVHRQADGDRLLRAAMERFRDDPDYAMSLGTLNADMFRSDEGKHWYLNASEGAEQRQDFLFASVAHYNLSILESRFYRFDLALERANASLASLNRSSGRLARGELYLRQLDIRSALSDYEAAYNMDSSPLSRLNLAQVYQTSGRLEEARAYAEDCLNAGDFSWMLNYGIDPVRYRRDVHEILKKIYEGLRETEKLRPYPALGEWIQSKAREAAFWFKAEVHGHLFRKYSCLSAAAYGEPHLDALAQYRHAFEPYPRRSLSYLRAARDFEVPLIPAALPGYTYEEGKLMNKRALIEAALPGFDPLWEKDMIAGGFAELAGSGARSFAEELYRLNPGALRQQGIRLPVLLRFHFSEGGRKPPQGRITGMLKRAGLRSITAANAGEARFVLTLNFETLETGSRAWLVYCELVDRDRGATPVSRDILLPSASRKDSAAFARELADAVF